MKLFSARRGVAAGLVGVLAVAVTAVAIGAAGAGVASTAADQYGGGSDGLRGTGTRLSLAGELLYVNVSATSGPGGEDAHGTFRISVETASFGSVSFRGEIHCLTVEGNRAAARGTVTKSTAIPVGTEFQIQVTDNKASGTPDTNIIVQVGPGDVGCPIIPADEIPITSGNFKVHDG